MRRVPPAFLAPLRTNRGAIRNQKRPIQGQLDRTILCNTKPCETTKPLFSIGASVVWCSTVLSPVAITYPPSKPVVAGSIPAGRANRINNLRLFLLSLIGATPSFTPSSNSNIRQTALVHGGLNVARSQVRIPHRGLNTSMAENLLDGCERHTRHDQSGCRCMPERMPRRIFDPCLSQGRFKGPTKKGSAIHRPEFGF